MSADTAAHAIFRLYGNGIYVTGWGFVFFGSMAALVLLLVLIWCHR